MKYKVFLVFIVYALSTCEVFSQLESCNTINSSQIPLNEKPLQGKAFINKFPNNEAQFFGNWTLAEIIVNGKTIVKNKMLRYDALNDEMLWMRESDYQMIALNRNEIEKVRFVASETTKAYTFIKIHKKNIQQPNNNDMFVQLLSSEVGKVMLLKKITSLQDQTTYKIVQKENYYLFINGEYKSFSLNKASFFRLFKNDKYIIKQTVKENQLRVKIVNDLIKAINIYNTKI